jgi:hypothetical protein
MSTARGIKLTREATALSASVLKDLAGLKRAATKRFPAFPGKPKTVQAGKTQDTATKQK